MRIAVEGCAHGELEKIYETLQHMEKENGIKIDLLICCGDFQAARNLKDLTCMAVPKKYQNMGSFYKYYSGEKVAPYLTIFIGGNHEASNHLQELSYGGWAAPNIYYLGYAGVINVAGVRIAGLSGIYKGQDYMRGHYEIAPYSEDSKRSVYHVRNLEVFRLKQTNQLVDVMITHDWPRGVTDYGDINLLLKHKPFFKKDIDNGALGSKPAEELLHELKPAYWFSAHLHCKFPAMIPHGPRRGVTRFLALDKCLPKRQFMQVLEIEHDEGSPIELSYDLEWLAIVHVTNHLLSVKKGLTYMPAQTNHERWVFTPTVEEKNHVLRRFGGDLKVPLNFVQTVPPFIPGKAADDDDGPSRFTAQLNPQTTLFCEILGVDDPLALLMAGCSQGNTPSNRSLPSFLTPDRSRNMSQVSFTSPSTPTFSSVGESSFQSSTSGGGASLKRTSLSLPPPKLSEDSSGDFLSFNVTPQESSTQEESLSQLSPEGSQSSSSSDKSRSRSPPDDFDRPNIPAKKFKRRNQALYTEDE